MNEDLEDTEELIDSIALLRDQLWDLTDGEEHGAMIGSPIEVVLVATELIKRYKKAYPHISLSGNEESARRV